MKPFIKSPGGKSKLCAILTQQLPSNFFKDKYTYVEPFLGGGALFLNLLTKDPSIGSRSWLNDINTDTWNVWQQVRQNPLKLIDSLNILKAQYSKEHFSVVRSGFIEYIADKVSTISSSDSGDPEEFRINRAARFVYLNKTCFNGLIRYNKRGIFNSPFGKYKNPGIFNSQNILDIHTNITPTRILGLDFEDLFKTLEAGSLLNEKMFVYLDPPYIPRSLTANFTSYSKEGFSLSDHERIKKLLDKLTTLKVKVLVSNSDTILTRELFKDYHISEINSRHLISCKISSRNTIKELLIRNY